MNPGQVRLAFRSLVTLYNQGGNATTNVFQGLSLFLPLTPSFLDPLLATPGQRKDARGLC